MQVEVIEMGNRPVVFSRARRYAPAGAKVMGELLAEHEFADLGLIVLDWSDELRLLPEGAPVKPMIHVKVRKRLPEFESSNVLNVECRLDVDDLFGNDEMTGDTILNIVNELKETVATKVAERRNT